MTTSIALADLTHTGQIIAANTVPLGISMIAAYAKDRLGERIDVSLFRYPDDLAAHLEAHAPRIVGFSNCSWNVELSHEFARRLKAARPATVIVFGGPNYPSTAEKRQAFLSEHAAIDFHVDGEGEAAFVALFEALEARGFDAKSIKRQRLEIANTDYLADGELVQGTMAPRLADLDQVPSPYLAGLNDKFFDDVLIPMMQTSRGCPYSCAFCHEGGRYFSKVRAASGERIAAELRYIAERAKAPDFVVVDSNFGILEQDLETCRAIAAMQDEHDWPRYVFVATAKNNKDRVVEAARLLPGTINPGAAVQSTNAAVLANIRRKNLPMEAVVDIAKVSEAHDANSFTEIILCLPGDTRGAHFQSVFDMVDLGINYVRMYQFMLLPGTEADTPEYRERFAMETRFRVLPRCFGRYRLFDDDFQVAEVEEICVANASMPFADYLECRSLNLTVEVFYNGSIFFELLQLLKRLDIAPSAFVSAVHERVGADDGLFAGLYGEYRAEEEKNLWRTPGDIRTFTAAEGVLGRYIEGEYGSNEIYAYRARFLFENMAEIHALAFDVARGLIREGGPGANAYEAYLDELEDYSLLRKADMLKPAKTAERDFSFDFAELARDNFAADPLGAARASPVRLRFAHDDWQTDTIAGYLAQYGTTINGLGRILLRANVKRLYRQTERVKRAAISA